MLRDTKQGDLLEPFPTKPFYSPAEVARILDVSDAHVLNLIHSKGIAAVRVSPRVIRISYATLMSLIGRPLPVHHEVVEAAEVEALRDELRNEDIEVPDDRLVLR